VPPVNIEATETEVTASHAWSTMRDVAGVAAPRRTRSPNRLAPPRLSDRVVEGPHVAQLSAGPLAFTLRRSGRARRLRVVIDPVRGVVVTLPVRRAGGMALVEAFLAEREAWLRRHLASQAREWARLDAQRSLGPAGAIRYLGEVHRLHLVPADPAARRSTVLRVGGNDGDELHLVLAPRDRRPPVRVLRDWLQARARAAIETELDLRARSLGVVPTGVTVRDQRTRWGSAARSGRLSFSWRLILAPPEALQTVVVHELAHLRVFGHGPEFWALVAGERPDHREWRRWLREHALELHTALDPLDLLAVPMG
jgi:predicted metal-dependent hydrolase